MDLSADLTPDVLDAFVRARYPDREPAELDAVEELIGALSSTGYRSIGDVAAMLERNAATLEEHERSSPPNGVPGNRFNMVGAVRVCLSLNAGASGILPAAPAESQESQLLLPSNIVSIMERSGRHKIAPHSSGEPDPLDPGWEPIIPYDVEQRARKEPEAYVRALAEVIVPVGGWAVYGAAELALDVMNHDLDNPSYRSLFVGGLEVRRKAEVPWVMLNSFDQVYRREAHPDEPWLPERHPPSRANAKITPLEVYAERRVAQVSPRDDSKMMFIARPEADRYVMVLETPKDDGGRLRGEMYAGSTQYDVYATVGERVIAHFWNDPEFAPFCKYVAPEL